MRMKLVARDALADRAERKGFSNRRLAKYAGCSAGTIDNLLSGKTGSLNRRVHAERICEALDVPIDVFFLPDLSSPTGRFDNHEEAAS